MNEGVPLEQPKHEEVDLLPILLEGGLDVDRDSVNQFKDLLLNRSDLEVKAQFQDLLIAHDEAKTDEDKKAAAANFANAVKPYL